MRHPCEMANPTKGGGIHEEIQPGQPHDGVHRRRVLSDAPTTKGHDYPLPSAGTEGNAVANYTRLAREGHAALLIKTRDEAAAEKVMAVVRQVPYSTAERYRRLVIEDL